MFRHFFQNQTQQLQLFKKYVVDLVSAAIPVLRSNSAILDGGHECSLSTDEHLIPIDTVWATMAIAKNHPEEIATIKSASNVASLALSEGVSKHLRTVMKVLQTAPNDLEKVTEKTVIEKYIFRGKHNAKEDLPAPKCALTVLSFPYRKNGNLFWGLFRGFEMASALLRDNVAKPENDERGKQLYSIIDGFAKCKLKTPNEKYTKEGLDILHKWMTGERDINEEGKWRCGSE